MDPCKTGHGDRVRIGHGQVEVLEPGFYAFEPKGERHHAVPVDLVLFGSVLRRGIRNCFKISDYTHSFSICLFPENAIEKESDRIDSQK